MNDFDENRNTSFTQFCDFCATRLFAGSDEAAFAARQSVCLAPANLACFQALVYLCALSRDVYNIVLPPLRAGTFDLFIVVAYRSDIVMVSFNDHRSLVEGSLCPVQEEAGSQEVHRNQLLLS